MENYEIKIRELKDLLSLLKEEKEVFESSVKRERASLNFQKEGIIQMAKEGKTIIVVSSEMPEILGITNRIAVMSNYRLAGIVNTEDTDQEALLRLSAKYL